MARPIPRLPPVTITLRAGLLLAVSVTADTVSEAGPEVRERPRLVDVSPASANKPVLITSARFGRTLDNAARRRRYLWTMAVRVVCFLSATVTPLPWNLLLLLAAAVLPTIAVMLANAIDQRTVGEPETEPPARPELPGSDVVKGVVEPEEDQR